MRRALLLAWFAAAAHAQEATAPLEAGITLAPDAQTAVGLTLLPWQREAPSDLDRPPALFAPSTEAIDGDAFARDAALDAARAAAVRQRLQRH